MANLDYPDIQEKSRSTKGTKEPQAVTPLNLELFGGETFGYCDAETGVCTVPPPTGRTGPVENRPQPEEAKHPKDLKEAPTE